MPDQEQERLRRLRERQIADRNPMVKQHKQQQDYSAKARRMRKPFKLGAAWKDIPHIIRTPFISLLIGVGVVFVLPMVWNSPYAIWVAVLIMVFLIVIGLVLGSTLDLRDNIKDQIK